MNNVRSGRISMFMAANCFTPVLQADHVGDVVQMLAMLAR